MKSISKEKIALFLILFIVFQPIIDALTTLSMYGLKIEATFGVVVRMLYMGISFLFMLNFFKEDRLTRISVIYLLIFGIFLMVNLTTSYFYKLNFIFMDEVKFLIKIAYFQVVLLSYILVFRYLKNQKINIKSIFFKGIFYPSLIIGFIMVISIGTNTSLHSYEYTKEGYTGWFFSGNELSALVSITFPIITYFTMKNIMPKLVWLVFILIAFTLIMIGTKVAYVALVGTLLISIIITFLSFLLKRRYLKQFFIFLLSNVILLVITPQTPVFKNTLAHMNILGVEVSQLDLIGYMKEEVFHLSDEKDKTAKRDKATKEKKVKKEPKKYNKEVENLILSSRDVFLEQHKSYYSKAPINQKMFGMGYSGNYEKEAKMIEIDYYDLFYSLGIIGFIIYFVPLLTCLIYILFYILKNTRILIFPEVLVLVSVGLGLGIAQFAGHVFTAPAVSIYLAFVIAYLSVNMKDINYFTGSLK